MCGICGVVAPGPSEQTEAVVRRMMDAMARRGPDEEGFLQAATACVGMRRLSIIDIGGGGQPVWNEAKTLAVVYNGEIYNFLELRGELQRAGHCFQSLADTEVIVHAYEEWGGNCVKRFEGMFAFALLEMPEGPRGPATHVFLARDPLGIKPLYYAVIGETFFFASEVRALLASGIVPRRLSPDALRTFLLFGSVGEPLTFVESVFSLPPGSCMSISATRPVAEVQAKSYWEFPFAHQEPGHSNVSKSSPARHVRALLEKAVDSHLIADVPVGIFLSSGLDSTAIATLASRAQTGVRTFTVAFPDIEFSEAEKARQTAARLHTEHNELMLSGQEMITRLDEAIAAFDQPSMDGVNTYFVAWAARQAGLKVALSGLGSDELFGGYTSFHATSTVKTIARLGGFFPRPVRAWAASSFDRSTIFGNSPDASRKGLAAWLNSHSLPDEYFFTRALFTPAIVAGTLGETCGMWPASPWWKWLSSAVAQSSSMDEFTRISWLESRSYLVNTLLRDTDAMSMHHSLEVRVPFLDLPLVEYVLSLPHTDKYVRGRLKSLLTEALSDLLPQEMVSQRKRTFTFPWENWLRGDLGKRVEKGLEDWAPALEPHVKKQFAIGIWDDFLNERTSWSRPWSLYVLNEWVKRHLTVTGVDYAPQEKVATGSAGSAQTMEATLRISNN